MTTQRDSSAHDDSKSASYSDARRKVGWRRILVASLKFAISFGILAYLFDQAWKHDQFARFADSEKQLGWLGLAVLSGFVACTIAFFRWHRLVLAIGLPFRWTDAVRLGFLGHLFNLLSFGVLGGDAIKAMFVARQMKGKATEAIASVFADRVIGLSAMFMFASVAYLCSDFSKLEAENPQALGSIQVVCRFAIVTSFLVVSLMYGLTIFENWQNTYVVRNLVSLPRVGVTIARLLQVVHIYRSKKRVIVGAYVLSFISIALFALSIYSIARGISDSFPSLISHLVIAPIAMVANAAPLPGGLGGMELAIDFLYRGFSQKELPSEHGFVIALGFRLILLAVASIGIVIYLFKKRELSHLALSENVMLDPHLPHAESR